MAGVTDPSTNYQQIVEQLLLSYAEIKPAYGELEVETIFDTQRDHYQIVHLGWQHQRWVHHCIIHLGIRNDKIWIFQNLTEHDIAADLVDLGVPKQNIVLGFYPPAMRAMSDYAVG